MNKFFILFLIFFITCGNTNEVTTSETSTTISEYEVNRRIQDKENCELFKDLVGYRDFDTYASHVAFTHEVYGVQFLRENLNNLYQDVKIFENPTRTKRYLNEKPKIDNEIDRILELLLTIRPIEYPPGSIVYEIYIGSLSELKSASYWLHNGLIYRDKDYIDEFIRRMISADTYLESLSKDQRFEC